jgi:hypothetical protein
VRLTEQLASWGRALGEREAAVADALETAWRVSRELHDLLAAGLERFHGAAEQAGAPQICIELSEPRTDDKHVRSVQFDLSRGRHRAIVTVKSEGVVTLVGPFRDGKTEGPCLRFEIAQGKEIEEALPILLEAFLDQAFAP